VKKVYASISERQFKYLVILMLIWCWGSILYLNFLGHNYYDSLTVLFFSLIPTITISLFFVYLLVTKRGSVENDMGKGDYADLSENQRWGFAALVFLNLFFSSSKFGAALAIAITQLLVFGTLWKRQVIGKNTYSILCVLLFQIEGTMMYFV